MPAIAFSKPERRCGTLQNVCLPILVFIALLGYWRLFLQESFELERQTWQQEREAHAAELKAWQWARVEHERERLIFEEERAQWERERRTHKPFWGTVSLESPFCLAYNTRRYKARLQNLPLGGNWHQACMAAQVEIHGRMLSTPERCEVSDEDVFGYWRVDFDEPECLPRWADYTWDKGCIRPGVRALEAPLWGQKLGDDVYAMCMTTPGRLSGHGDMGHPTYCEQRGDRDIGMVGRWEIPDSQCW